MPSKKVLEEKLHHATATMKHALRSESAGKINAMVDLARSEPGVPILPEEMDADGWLLNCKNGTLDLKTGELRGHRREDFITKLCPVVFDAGAQAPLWQAFLATVFARADAGRQAELIGYVQRMLGYCLTGDVSEQVLFIFWGTGANGKSTLLNVLLALLGEDYAIKAASDLLMVKRGEVHPTEKADLLGKRLVACIESDENRRLAESLVKDLTGGDRQRARRMREDFWEFSPTHKLVLCTNHKPQIRGTDHAIWRRVRLVPFTVKFSEDKQDKGLPDKLKKELPGILAWCVRGCLAWQKEGLGLPEEVKAATEDYRKEQDLLADFLEECCLQGPGHRASAAALYARYLQWCESNGEKNPATKRQFGMSLTERGFERSLNNGVWYRGVAPKGDAAE